VSGLPGAVHAELGGPVEDPPIGMF
jgi:hypothetical protein